MSAGHEHRHGGGSQVYVTCDVPGCPARAVVKGASTFGYARVVLERIGWSHVLLKRTRAAAASIDRCPEHREHDPAVTPPPISPQWHRFKARRRRTA